MGGDGGSLNNSRREHALLRTQILGTSSKPNISHLKERSSVTLCTASKQPLQEPHVVVDRIGQLYNKDALISSLLHRAEQTALSDHPSRFHPLQHIRSLRKDTAAVKLVRDGKNGPFICSVTRKVVTPEGRFTVGWQCGCVTAIVEGVKGMGSQVGDDETVEEVCMSCSMSGMRVPLGLPLAERQERKKRILEKRKEKSGSDRKRKRRKGEDVSQLKRSKLACDSDVVK